MKKKYSNLNETTNTYDDRMVTWIFMAASVAFIAGAVMSSIGHKKGFDAFMISRDINPSDYWN